MYAKVQNQFNAIISKDFEVTTGVRQGDALFSVLFNLVLVVRELPECEP